MNQHAYSWNYLAFSLYISIQSEIPQHLHYTCVSENCRVCVLNGGCLHHGTYTGAVGKWWSTGQQQLDLACFSCESSNNSVGSRFTTCPLAAVEYAKEHGRLLLLIRLLRWATLWYFEWRWSLPSTHSLLYIARKNRVVASMYLPLVPSDVSSLVCDLPSLNVYLSLVDMHGSYTFTVLLLLSFSGALHSTLLHREYSKWFGSAKFHSMCVCLSSLSRDGKKSRFLFKK